MKKQLLVSVAVSSALLFLPVFASADTLGINFEPSLYTVGNINGQDGWSSLGAAGSGCAVYDHAVSGSFGTTGFGAQSLRISNAVVSGCFSDQTFSKSLINEAGETAAINSGFSGGTRQTHFESQFDLASAVPGAEQPGLYMSVSPDRGDGARMSYLRFEDQSDGIHVFFDDYTASGFNETDIATLDRSVPHSIKFVMDFVDGSTNDIVKIYIDNVLKITGTSWERYFEDNQPTIAPPTVDSLLFRTGGGAGNEAIGTLGKGFLIDNLSLASGFPDIDADGVADGDDLCPATGADEAWEVSWGQNRWQVQSTSSNGLTWFQNKVGKKGATTPTAGQSIAYTYGCNGHQILKMLKDELGDVMGGHWKYGISSGVLEEFHNDLNDGILDGQYLVDTVTVPANDEDGVSSLVTLLSGHDYLLKASGTADACVSGCGYSIIFDPEYSSSNGGGWVDGVDVPYVGSGPNLLDLMVDGGFVNWGAYNASHTYSYGMTGVDAPVVLKVNDLYYLNNTGSLTVNIFAQI
ncbi:MAG: hypothetical protein AAB449_01280 [Patescibacteria group bacterium]